MNVYMIREDGEDKLWKAPTMYAAIKAAEDRYVQEERARNAADHFYSMEEEWRAVYGAKVMESCTLVGELANP